ncbi:CAP-Gly protein [Yersinia enterocolitica]|uniref:YrzE family protein n=1 Tax=Yersinia TaxID=629 RepID=UPI003AB23E2A
MEATELSVVKKISWGSVMGGVITVIAVSLLLSMLGTGLGFSVVDPQSDDPVNSAGTAVAIWSALSVLISLTAGAFISGRLAANDGLIHGFLVWATSLIVATILGGILVSSAVKTAGNAFSALVSASGNVISGAGSVIGSGASSATDVGINFFDKLGLESNLQSEKLQDDIVTALKKSNIPSLQPDFMRQQLDDAKKEIAESVKALVVDPQNSDQIIQSLLDKLKRHTDAITQGVDQDAVKQALKQNTNLTSQEIDKTTQNLIDAKDKASEIVNQRLKDAEVNINQAKQEYAEFVQKTKDKAEKVASALSRAALWSFFALLIGAIVSAAAGLWGVNTNHRRYLKA